MATTYGKPVDLLANTPYASFGPHIFFSWHEVGYYVKFHREKVFVPYRMWSYWAEAVFILGDKFKNSRVLPAAGTELVPRNDYKAPFENLQIWKSAMECNA